MSKHESKLPESARIALEGLFAEIRISRASDLARCGRYHEAEEVLKYNGALPELVAELDLLARIAGQQGHYDEASNYWLVAHERGMNTRKYEALQRALQNARNVAKIKRKFTAISILTFAITIMVFTVFTLWPSKKPEKTKLPVLQTTSKNSLNQNSEKSEPPVIIFKLPQPPSSGNTDR